MSIRLRITLLFVSISFLILTIVCGTIYFFSCSARLDTMNTRLLNRAITMANLRSHKKVFNAADIRLINASTTLSFINKNIAVYNNSKEKVYAYSDNPKEIFHVGDNILEKAKKYGSHYFTVGTKEAIAFHNKASGDIIISAGDDLYGKQNLNKLVNTILISFWLGNISVWICGYLFSYRLLNPIREITRNITEIFAENLSRRIVQGKIKDEWYQLSFAVNQLLERLQHSFQLQSRFILNASHELSAPLACISSQIDITTQKERSVADYKQVLNSVSEDVLRMRTLMHTLLDLARTSDTSGGIKINSIRIDEVLMKLPAELAKTNPCYALRIISDEMPENDEQLLVLGNEELLFTAIKNIVVNACKYSADHTAIVQLKICNNQLCISIEDKGIGINAADLSNIFQPFYRAEENTNKNGYGLGLSLAEHIIKLHKGFVLATSKIGKGSVFTIQLPSSPILIKQEAVHSHFNRTASA